MSEPQPESHWKCPNCGAALPYAGAFCANCGVAPPKVKAGNALAFTILFIFLGIPAGLFGACCILLVGNEPSSQGAAPFVVMGLGAVGLAVLLLVLMIRSFIAK